MDAAREQRKAGIAENDEEVVAKADDMLRRLNVDYQTAIAQAYANIATAARAAVYSL